MHKIFTFLIITLFINIGISQTTIFDSPGGGAFPMGWTSANNNTNEPIDKNSYYLVETNPVDFIETATYDLSSYTSATFSLDVASFGGGTHNSAKIEISNDGGASYNQTEASAVTTSSSYINGGSFSVSSLTNQVKIRISNNGATGRGVRLKNLELEAAGTVNDSDTEVYDTNAQPPAANISSTVDNVGAAIDVFSFTIEDQGSGDGLPTRVTKILLKPHSTNTADFTDNIQGIVLNDGTNVLTPSSVTIMDTGIEIELSNTELVIADGGSQNIKAAVYLNNSNIKDNAVISFFIDADDNGFASDGSGSAFSSNFLLEDFNSDDFTIDVEATQIIVKTQPSDVAQGNVMNSDVEIAYTDTNGNVDVDYDSFGNTTSVTTTGTFDGSATTTVPAVMGIATFDNLIFSAQGTGLTITANDISSLIAGPPTVTTNTFDVTAPAAAPGDIVISEFMPDPSCDNDATSEYFELYNTTNSDIDINGWTVDDDGSDSHTFNNANGTTIVPAMGYLLCAINNNSTYFGFSPAYDYAGTNLVNGADEIVLKDGSTTVCRVDYTDSNPFGAGVSIQLPENYDYSLADDGVIMENEFVEPNTTFGCGDFGTPGQANTLPIELISFTVSKFERTILLKWQTASELNNDFMVIETSTDGVNFKKIGRVKGAGTTNQTQQYQLVHENPSQGLNYYRLLQVDYDGTATYSKVVNVNFAQNNGDISIYPNPTTDDLTIKYPANWEGETVISVLNGLGQVVKVITNPIQTFSVSDLPVGLYNLRITNGRQSVSKPFIKN